MNYCLLLSTLLFMIAHNIFSLPSTDQIANLMNAAIKRKEIPGGVVLIQHKGETIYHEAFGNRMVTPEIIPATRVGLYDLTSLTKLYTSTLIMQLHDKKKLDITKPVATYLTAFRRPDKKDITIEQLLTHCSGLPIIMPTTLFSQDLAKTVAYIGAVSLDSTPGTAFLYSDLGTVTASFLAQRVTGIPFDKLLQKYLFDPLNLNDTMFTPSTERLPLVAPTKSITGKPLHGRPWSPRTQAMGGIGGHSGLFATAADVAAFGQLFLQDGVVQGTRLLSPESITLMTTPYKGLPKGIKRAIGFDFNTDSAFARGTVFDEDSFGHSGVAGTSLWIDKKLQALVVVLCNRSHASLTGNTKQLRSDIATQAAKMVIARQD